MSSNVTHWLITQYNLHRAGDDRPTFPTARLCSFPCSDCDSRRVSSLSLPDGVNAASSKLWCKTREGVFLNCGLIFELDVTLRLMVMLQWFLKYNYLGVLTLKY